MKARFWIGVLVGVLISAVLWLGNDRYQELRYSNRRLTHLKHPITGDRITVLVLGGISHDVTYLTHGYTQSLEVPDESISVEMRDELGIRYTDSTWVVYYVDSLKDTRSTAWKNVSFEHLTPRSHNDLVKNGYDRFLYRGSF
jgi:hypothetical protein